MPASHLQTLRAMAYNNAWANHRLLAACAGLTQAEFEAPRTGFFPTIQSTLNHILIIDRFYVDALETRRRPPRSNRGSAGKRPACRSLD